MTDMEKYLQKSLNDFTDSIGEIWDKFSINFINIQVSKTIGSMAAAVMSYRLLGITKEEVLNTKEMSPFVKTLYKEIVDDAFEYKVFDDNEPISIICDFSNHWRNKSLEKLEDLDEGICDVRSEPLTRD
jgi:hypothetical protein